MSCECVSEQEKAADFMAKTSQKKQADKPTVLDHLGQALAQMDNEQEQTEPGSETFNYYRQSREKLKALMKFIDARLYQ